MDPWMAARVGLEVKVFFPAVQPSIAKGEDLWLRVVEKLDGQFIGEVLTEPRVNVGVGKGEKVRLPLWKVEEVRT